MLIRATIVLLAVLNLGAAAWWLWRPEPVAAGIEQPAGVPRLVLLEEIAAVTEPPQASPTPAPAADRADAADAADTAGQDDPAPKQAAAAKAKPAPVEPGFLAAEPRCDGSAGGESRGWRVELPPAADLASAQAVAQRIAAAGFDDYLVLTDGVHANGIALGMFSTEAAAQRRRAALRAAGFPARCARIAASTPA